MAGIQKYGYIFKAPGFHNDRRTMDSGSFRAEIAAVGRIEDACGVARELVSEGVELIELCGSFGEKGAAMVSEAVAGVVPVAFVSREIPGKG